MTFGLGYHPRDLSPLTLTGGEKLPTAACLFSGMGGFTSGLDATGFEIRWAVDNDHFACEAFRHRFPHVRMLEKDVCDVSVRGNQLAAVDVMTAGFPCQSFSQAGNRRGFSDPRGELFFEIPRLIAEYPESDKPALVVLENVPHLLYGASGSWFDSIRRSMRRAGYWFREHACWSVNVKDATVLPQDRERLFMVAASRACFSRNPFSPPLLPSPPGSSRRPLSDFIDPDPARCRLCLSFPDNRYYKMISRAMCAGESEANVYQLRRSYVREKKHDLCPTLTAKYGDRRAQCPLHS